MAQYAVSDIHGCHKTFTALLDKLALSTSDELYLLGDHVSRGPDSKGVLDLIFKLQGSGYQIHCLRGNHEELMLQVASGNLDGATRWLSTDGQYILDSFGVQSMSEIPELYFRWIAALPYYFEVGKYILVHAGLDFSLSDPLSSNDRLCWIRNWYGDIRYDWLKKRIILHGHTPTFIEVIKDQLKNLSLYQYLDIDAGCVFAHERFTKKEGLGYLCSFNLENRKMIFQRNVDYDF